MYNFTIDETSSQGRVVNPRSGGRGYLVYGAPQQLSVSGEGHVRNSTTYFFLKLSPKVKEYLGQGELDNDVGKTNYPG